MADDFRAAVADALRAFLDAQAEPLSTMGPPLSPLLAMARRALSGGKRLRPAFCVWSYLAAGGDLEPLPAVLEVAASLELLHVSALVHDDVIDSSDRRRGAPSAHRLFEALHVDSGWVGDPVLFGRAGAILLGDLLSVWSVQMAQESGLAADRLERALPPLEAMRTEVNCGQYLDLVAQVPPLPALPESGGPELEAMLEKALRVVEYKSARYTVQRPCQAGAAMAGAPPELKRALAGYGSALGGAFQFRDDLLGVFGDPQRTGKPAGDDLREGKRTVLIAHALAGTDQAGRELMNRRLGDPGLDDAGVRELQEVIVSSGACEAVEEMIRTRHRQALQALAGADLTPEGRTALTCLAEQAIHRQD